jgi:histidinol-phosphate aminotransferase
MSICQLINLARKDVINLVPYRSARNESNQGGIHLDANENPFVSPRSFNRYPEPQPVSLLQKLGALYDVSEPQLLITRGSDEAIDLLIRVFCQANQDGILITPPTYGMYSVSASIQGAFIASAPLLSREFVLDVDAIIKQWQPTIKLIFLCSPNNPTGNTLDVDAVLGLCEYFRDKALIVIDEAYIEFSTCKSLTRFLDQFPNLVILRTLSKAYGLAGIRCGSVVAHPEIIALLRKIIAPYPIPTPVLQVVLERLSATNAERTKSQIKIIQAQREELRAFLQNHVSVKYVYASEANFLLVAVESPKQWMEVCHDHGIVIRDRSNIPGLSNCVRITIGTPEENKTLQEVLRHV